MHRLSSVVRARSIVWPPLAAPCSLHHCPSKDDFQFIARRNGHRTLVAFVRPMSAAIASTLGSPLLSVRMAM